jgi:hypothetical protein
MTERRYSDDEVAAIFERATKSQAGLQRQQPEHASAQGMTIGELQQIGRDVGIPAELVASAAREIDVAGRPTERKLIGLPIGVGRTVELPRRLNDDEWERVVADLRETFDARGSLRSEGSTRMWSNGNLQVMLEPTATSHRLRMRTIKGDARGYIGGGIGIVVATVLSAAFKTMGGDADVGMLAGLSSMTVLGLGMIAAGTLRLPSWAKTRKRQMEEIAGRTVALTEEAPRPLTSGSGRSSP